MISPRCLGYHCCPSGLHRLYCCCSAVDGASASSTGGLKPWTLLSSTWWFLLGCICTLLRHYRLILRKKKKRALISNMCQCSWYKYFHCGQIQAANMNFNQPSLYKFASVHQWLEVGGRHLTIEMKAIQRSHSSAPEAVARVLVKRLSALFLIAAHVPLNGPGGEPQSW